MINLLPSEGKKILTREYVMRVLSVSMLATAFVFVSLAVLSVPTWYLLEMSESVIDSHLPAAEAARNSYDELVGEISMVNRLTEHLSQSEGRLEPSLLIEDLDRLGGSAIDITEFVFGGEGQVTLSGVADTRSALSTFRDYLEEDERFGSVELPLSSLVNDQDAAFTITLTLNPE